MADDPRSEPPAGPSAEAGLAIARVERAVRIDAPAEAVWRSLTDPDELSAWLGGEVGFDRPVEPGTVGALREEDGSLRHLLVTEVEPGRRLVWHWWREGGELSSVEITARPDGDVTEVRVIEVVARSAATAGGSRPSLAALESHLDATWAAALPALAGRLGQRLGALPSR